MAAWEGAQPGSPWEARLQWISDCVARCDPLKRVADRLGCSPWALAAAGCAWALGFLLWGFTGELICLVAGLLYPMWASFQALEDAHEDFDGRAAQEWLAYWVTHAVLTLLECVLYRFIWLVPFYHPLRLVFIVWLFHPSWRGATTVYKWVVAPMLRLHRPTVDAALARAAVQLQESFNGQLREELQETLRGAATGGVGLARDLGIEELVAKELTKGVVARLGVADRRSLDNSEPPFSFARARTATPPPRPSYSPQKSYVDED